MLYRKAGLVFYSLFILFLIGPIALATSVDRMSIVNLEGYAGETIKQEIILEGVDPEERSGFWYTHYKQKDGDSENMDITSWLMIEPGEYLIKQGEAKTFTINIKIPKNIKPGLYGATSEEAGREGHSNERRTYIVFKDALSGGNVYSGLLIPISVKVLPSSSPLASIFNFISQNILVVILFFVIVIMTILLFKKRKKVVK